MKTVTQIAFAALTTFPFTIGGAFASDSEWIAIDNHQGSVNYLFRPSQRQTTVGLYAHGKGIGRADDNTSHCELRLMQRYSAHGTINYFAPVK